MTLGSVVLLNHMGSDLEISNDARVSLNKHSDWDIDPVTLKRLLRGSDENLIKFLADHEHWTPFGQQIIKFRYKMPIMIAREWFRHTVGFVRNEVSRRYVDYPLEFFIPDEYRLREPGKKQGSSDKTHQLSGQIHQRQEFFYRAVQREYETQLEEGIAPEVARGVMPVSGFTEFTETGSLYAYSHLAGLRISPDAQKETREYAEAVGLYIKDLFPVAWKSLRAAATRKDRMSALLKSLLLREGAMIDQELMNEIRAALL